MGHHDAPLVEADCGTPAGANRHHYLGEPICDSCHRAAARYRRQLRAATTGGGDRMSIDCDDLGLPNQYELPQLRPGPDPKWAQHAACIGKPLEWFFPHDSSIPLEASETCAACPVQLECLQHALRVNEHDGIWGGKNAMQRRRLRRSTRTRPSGTAA